MKNLVTWPLRFILIMSVVLLAGCNPQERANGVAVIDLDRLAAAIGRDKQITARVQQFAKEKEEKLNKLKDELNTKIADEKKKLGKKPKQKDRERINQLAQDYNNHLRQEINKVTQAADRLRSELVMDFRNEVEPVARRIAQKKKLAVVMIKQNGMLYIDPVVDITNGVIDELQQAVPSVTGTSEK